MVFPPVMLCMRGGLSGERFSGGGNQENGEQDQSDSGAESLHVL